MIELLAALPTFATLPEPISWPAGTPGCTVTLTLADRQIAEVDLGECDPALAGSLLAMRGVAVDTDARTVVEVELYPAEPGATVTPELEAPWWISQGWPVEFRELKDVPRGTRCSAHLAVAGRDEEPVVEVAEGCPAKLAKLLERSLEDTTWIPPVEGGAHSTMNATWTADPADPARPALLLDGPARPRRRINPVPPTDVARPASARCIVRVEWSDTGEVHVLGVESCDPPFAESARAAHEQWLYWPAVIDGVPQGGGSSTQAVTFELL